MKITEIIVEGKFDPYQPYELGNPGHDEVRKVDKLEELRDILETHCSEILTCYRKTQKWLFRGVSKGKGPVIVTGIRQDRRPLQMQDIQHDLINLAYAKLGIAAHRGNSIFCTADISTAADWGETYVVFPKNGWSGSWMPSKANDYAFYYLQSLARAALSHSDWEINEASINHLVKEIQIHYPIEEFDASNFSPILSARPTDLLITGDSYIGIKPLAPNTTLRKFLHDITVPTESLS